MERGLGIRSGAHKQGWEESEFPIVCETCLGDNAYVRMLKHPLGGECKICGRPFTVFKWKAGTKGRFKKTEICQTCAKLKNCCQTCLFDLDYGLPIQVRDKFLGKDAVDVPTCEGNRDYWAQLANENIDTLALPYKKKENPILKKLARTTPYYERNRPKVCTFWLQGKCKRGALCPYRHELDPHERNSSQNIKDRFFGVNDPVAKKIFNRIENSRYVRPPKDKSLRTLVISHVSSDLTTKIKNTMSEYGQIDDFSLIKTSLFVTYNRRKSAEEAIKALFCTLVIDGKKLSIVWAKKTSDKAKDTATLHLPEFSLIPSFDNKLQHIKGPRPPRNPPMKIATEKDKKDHLMSMMKADDNKTYDTMKKDNHGGKKKNIKFNLVGY